jgi:hypothetical protein
VNTLRSYLFIVAGVIYLTILLVCMHSCSLTECLGVKCVNGICTDGTCNCDAGYYGPSCDTIIRNKFLGKSFTVSSSCFPSESYYSKIDTISKSNLSQVVIENMGNFQINVFANIVGVFGLNIPPQQDTSGGQSLVISGSGSMTANHNVLTLKVIYSDANYKWTDTCTEIYVRDQY